MNHDPMCPYFPEQQGFGGIRSGVPSTQPYIPGVPCQCALIARIREDERGKAVWQRDLLWGDGYAAALRDAVEAAKAAVTDDDPDSVSDRYDCCGCSTYDAIYRDAVAAIEALGGKQ